MTPTPLPQALRRAARIGLAALPILLAALPALAQAPEIAPDAIPGVVPDPAVDDDLVTQRLDEVDAHGHLGRARQVSPGRLADVGVERPLVEERDLVEPAGPSVDGVPHDGAATLAGSMSPSKGTVMRGCVENWR